MEMMKVLKDHKIDLCMVHLAQVQYTWVILSINIHGGEVE